MTEATGEAAYGINPRAVEQWFKANVPNIEPPLEFKPIAGGQSNLTFRVSDSAGKSFALRRPPLGILPPRTHDVAREYRIQAALRGTAVPVPNVLGVCTDREVNGADFYVMDWIEGTIVDSPARARASLPTPDARKTASNHMIDALSALHRLDFRGVGLGDLSRGEDFIGRNLGRMYELWEKTKTREYSLIDSLYAILVDRKPQQKYTGIIHSDFRFGNMMLDSSFRVIAVLDWELCTIGDVLADLGFLINNWDLPADQWPDVWTEIAPTRAGDFPSRDDVIDRYAGATGFDVEHLNYYRAFNYWRIAVIAEGIKRRYLSGAMAQQEYDPVRLEKRVTDRAELAEYFLSL